jgi:hypothetical protein
MLERISDRTLQQTLEQTPQAPLLQPPVRQQEQPSEQAQ